MYTSMQSQALDNVNFKVVQDMVHNCFLAHDSWTDLQGT